jgi:hypothetical protein
MAEPEVKEKLYPESEFKFVVKQRDEVKTILQQQEAELATLRQFKQEQADAQAKLETQKAIESGKAAEMIKAAQAQADRKIADERQNTYNALKAELVPQTARAAVASIPNIMPTAVEDAGTLLAARLDVDPKTFKIYVKDAEGKPLTKADGSGLVAPAEFAKELLKDKPHFLASKLVGNTGGKVETAINGQNKTWDQLSRDELDKLQKENPVLEKQMYEAYEEARRSKEQRKREKRDRKAMEQMGQNVVTG